MKNDFEYVGLINDGDGLEMHDQTDSAGLVDREAAFEPASPSEENHSDALERLQQVIRSASAMSFSPDDLSFRRYRSAMIGVLFVALFFTTVRFAAEAIHSLISLYEPYDPREMVYTPWDTAATLLNLFLVYPYFFLSYYITLRCQFVPYPSNVSWVPSIASFKANPFQLVFYLGIFVVVVLFIVAIGGDVAHTSNIRLDPFLGFRLTFDLLQLLSFSLVIINAAYLSLRIVLTTRIPPLLQVSWSFFHATPDFTTEGAALDYFQQTDYGKIRRFVFKFNTVIAAVTLFPAVLISIFGLFSIFKYGFLSLCFIPPLIQLVMSCCPVPYRNRPYITDNKLPLVFQSLAYSVVFIGLILGAVFQVVPQAFRESDEILIRFFFGFFYYPLCLMGVGSLLELLFLVMEYRRHLIILDLSTSSSEDQSLIRRTTISQQFNFRRALGIMFLLFVSGAVAQMSVFISLGTYRLFFPILIFALLHLTYPILALATALFGGCMSILYPVLVYTSPIPFIITLLINIVSGYVFVAAEVMVYVLYIASLVQLIVLFFGIPMLVFMQRSVRRYPESTGALFGCCATNNNVDEDGNHSPASDAAYDDI